MKYKSILIFLLGLILGYKIVIGDEKNKWQDWKYKYPFKVINPAPFERKNYFLYLELNTIKFIKANVMDSSGKDIRIIDKNFEEIPYRILDGTLNSLTTLILIPVNLKPKETKTFFLLFGNTRVNLPRYYLKDEEEIFFPIESGNTECNINFWQKETIRQEGNLFPLAGEFFYKITIKPIPVYGDHFANTPIKYRTDLNISLEKEMYLEYDILVNKKTEFASSIQSVVEGNLYTWCFWIKDQKNISFWEEKMDLFYINKWYHRQINTENLKSKKIKELFFMINDRKASSCGEEIIFYFDNIRFTKGEPVKIKKPFFYDFIFSFFWDKSFFFLYFCLIIGIILALIIVKKGMKNEKIKT